MTGLELARGNYLRPNGHGGYLISYSQLNSWARCNLQKHYEDRAKVDPDAPQPAILSQTAYGSVVHYALMIMEKAVHEGRDDALALGLSTFEYYWQPENIGAIADKVTDWLPRQTYGGLRERGRHVIKDMYDLLRKDDSFLLGLEYEFHVPMTIDGRTHTIRGLVDRLAIKKYHGKPYVSLDDYKSGKQTTYLRHNIQFSLYAWASTLPEFWHGWAESGLEALDVFDDETIGRLDRLMSSWGYKLHSGSHGELPLASRRGRWINLQELKFADAGWRTERDYARLTLAVDAYVRANEAEIYSVNADGYICRYCPFRGDCGGVGLPHESAGAP